MAVGTTTALLIMAGTTALGAGTSFMQARSANEAAEARVEAEQRAAEIQAKQLETQAAFDKEEVTRKAHLIESSIRVAAGESGIGEGGTFNALITELSLNVNRNLGIIDVNELMNIQRVKSGVSPKAPSASPFLAGFAGGLGGLSAGLSLTTNAMTIGDNLRGRITTSPSITPAPRLPTRGLRGS